MNREEILEEFEEASHRGQRYADPALSVEAGLFRGFFSKLLPEEPTWTEEEVTRLTTIDRYRASLVVQKKPRAKRKYVSHRLPRPVADCDGYCPDCGTYLYWRAGCAVPMVKVEVQGGITRNQWCCIGLRRRVKTFAEKRAA